MICQRCLHRASALRMRSFTRPVTTSAPASSLSKPPAATSTSAPQPFSTPLSSAPNAVSLGANLRPKPKPTSLPVSSAPAGMSLRGLNFIKGREDPIALPEEEYPDWLWRCLDTGKKGDDASTDNVGDEFSKSKKQRRVAAKRQRMLEAQLLASGDTEALEPKIPLQQQTIDLPANQEGTVRGALEAVEKREELQKAMRKERRAKIKERNFLKGMR